MIASHRRALLGTVVSLFVLSLAGSALADPTPSTYVEAATGDGQNVVFKDDPMQAGGFGPKDVILKTRPSAVRMVLVRPRTQFVMEMIKSVESL